MTDRERGYHELMDTCDKIYTLSGDVKFLEVANKIEDILEVKK